MPGQAVPTWARQAQAGQKLSTPPLLRELAE